MTLNAGVRLGPYEIVAPIGAGGMGEVYKARDTRLDRTVAIKILPPEFSADPERRARFEREAKTIAGLSHPHICTLYDVGRAPRGRLPSSAHELPLTYRGMRSSERKRRALQALEKVGMSHRVKHYPSQLSGGQQQRVAVARALAGQPSILLADEPTGNLDSASGRAVMDLPLDLHREGATICMVTHDPRYAQCAQRTVQLFDGRAARVNVFESAP